MAMKVDSKFPGAEKHEITFKEARKLIKRHTKSPIHPKHHGGSFDRAAIDKILAQPGCARLRFYHGKNEDGTPAMILVGIDAEGNDMAKGCIMDTMQPCPPFCDPPHIFLK
jgi:hypothetical protein